MITLLHYQKPSAEALLRILARPESAAADASDTGVGKMYIAAYVAAALGARAVVVCPLAIVPEWAKVLKLAGVKSFRVVNYDTLKRGKSGFGKWVKRPPKRKLQWEWDMQQVPLGSLIIFDEAHACKSPTSKNAEVLRGSREGYRVLMTSATLAENPMEMRALGHVLGLFDWDKWFSWCKRNGCSDGPFGGLYFRKTGSEDVLAKIHANVFPENGVRVKVSELGDAFPETHISAHSYDLNDGGEVQKAYEEAEEKLRQEMIDNPRMNTLTILLRARQASENAKLPLLLTMTEDGLAEGKSVAVFLNFREPVEKLQAMLREKLGIEASVVQGCASASETEARSAGVEAFQNDEARVILVNIQAGGAGLSLHDVTGKYPRLSLISPTYNAKHLRQVFGRVWRTGGKSKSIQRVVFAAGSVEEEACRAVQGKLDNLDMLNDGDLSGFKII